MPRKNIAYLGDTNLYKKEGKFWTEKDFPSSAYLEEGEGTYKISLENVLQVMTDPDIEFYQDDLNYLAEIDKRLVSPVYLPIYLVEIIKEAAKADDVSMIKWILDAIHAQLEAREAE